MSYAQDQLTACTNLYVEEALAQHFGDLVRFVTEAEAAAKASGAPEASARYSPQQAAPIMKDFASRWTAAIEALNKCALHRPPYSKSFVAHPPIKRACPCSMGSL